MDWGDTSSHNTGKSIVATEEQTALEDVNHLDDEEKDNETKEGVTDDLNQFLYPKYYYFFSSMKRHMKRKHGKEEEKILKWSLSKPTESFKRMC